MSLIGLVEDEPTMTKLALFGVDGGVTLFAPPSRAGSGLSSSVLLEGAFKKCLG